MSANGRWTKLRGKLKPIELAPQWQEQVEQHKRGYTKLDVATLAKTFAQHKRRKDSLGEKVTVENAHLEALSQLLVERLEGEEQEQVTLRGGLTVYISDEPQATVVDRALVFKWIKQQRMVQLLTVHPQTLNGLVKEYLAAGKAVPPGIKVFLRTRARVRGISRKKVDEE